MHFEASMTPFRIASLLNRLLEPELLWIEVSSTLQLPSMHIVGLAGPEVAEAKERIRAAILSSGFDFPQRRVVLNLSPAHVRKQGTGLDLPMALALLAAQAQSHSRSNAGGECVAWGELGLDGALKPTGQALRTFVAAWKSRVPRLILASSDASELLRRLKTIPSTALAEHPIPRLHSANTLQEAREILFHPENVREVDLSQAWLTRLDSNTRAVPEPTPLPLSPSLERILGTAAAGRHHLLLVGPRGAGKSHALETLQRLQLPEPESLSLLRGLIQDLRGERDPDSGARIRRVGSNPRASSLQGSLAQGSCIPGEFALAHGGVLVADELPEWPRDARESLREPLETGWVTLNRVRDRIRFPADFQFAATGNLCPCGSWDGSDTSCACPPPTRDRYLARLSGPILDRIDLVVRMQAAAPDRRPWNPSRTLEKVQRTRERCERVWGKAPGRLSALELESLLTSHPEWTRTRALSGTPSLRSRHKILRVALTLAAWDEYDSPQPAHWMEAPCYRWERLGT